MNVRKEIIRLKYLPDFNRRCVQSTFDITSINLIDFDDIANMFIDCAIYDVEIPPIYLIEDADGKCRPSNEKAYMSLLVTINGLKDGWIKHKTLGKFSDWDSDTKYYFERAPVTFHTIPAAETGELDRTHKKIELTQSINEFMYTI
ncbi:MAG: hypothetical protein ACR2MS_02600 [Weeksellaceae bacterium]